MNTQIQVNVISNGAFCNLEQGRQMSLKVDRSTEMYTLSVSKRGAYIEDCYTIWEDTSPDPLEIEKLVKEYTLRYGEEVSEQVLAGFKSVLQPMGNDWFRA